MAQSYGSGVDQAFTVSENLSAKQYYLMKQGTTLNSALLGDTAGGVVIGVLLEDGLDASSQTKHATIRTEGEVLVVAGNSCTIGDPLQDGGSGKAITATTGDYVIGRAREAAGADGDVILMQITHEGTF
jgi:hypothetical protein